MDTKHTQGEWVADRGFKDASDRNGEHTTISDDFLTVFMGGDDENYIEVHGPNQKANASLVEVAPELLALAIEVAQMGCHERAVDYLRKRAAELITKATPTPTPES
jgi:hypothetical protein